MSIEVFSGLLLWLVIPAESQNTFLFNRQIWLSIHLWNAVPAAIIILSQIAISTWWVILNSRFAFKVPFRSETVYSRGKAGEAPIPEIMDTEAE